MEIVNIVASGTFNQPLSFDELQEKLGDAFIPAGPKYQHGAYLRLGNAKVTIYKSGKYIMPGIPSFDAVNARWEELVSLLFTVLDVTVFEPPVVKNIVAQETVGRTINLVNLFAKLRDETAEYEPEVFPGLIWKTEYGTANIFNSGRIVLLGVANVDELNTLRDFVVKKFEEMGI